MHTRRSAIAGLAGVTLVAAAPASFAADDSLPSAKTVAGKPPYMDYGDGVKVPLSKGAFATLWEGPNYWLTFGFGSASVGDRAKELASHRAAGAMKYLLLTLAFAPNRLEKVPGNGWRQKVETPANYVIGELDLPGRPGLPATDAAMGFGNADANLFVTAGGGPGIGPGTSDTAGTFSGMNRAAMLKGINAFCSYIIMKKDLNLNDVRARARQVVL